MNDETKVSEEVTPEPGAGGGGAGGSKRSNGSEGKGGNGKGEGAIVQKTSWREFLMSYAPQSIFFLVALAIALSIVSIFWPYFAQPPRLDKTLLQLLSDTETARGLITFLVALTTVGIALILIIYLATSSVATDELKDRFAFSKEVMTSLIGILGTIIGFYFGASQGQTSSHVSPAALSLANLSITPSNPVTGSKVRLDATLSGGQPPYHYEIRFTQDGIKKIDGDSSNGTITQEVKLDRYDQTQPLDITLEGTDASGAFSGKLIHLAAAP